MSPEMFVETLDNTEHSKPKLYIYIAVNVTFTSECNLAARREVIRWIWTRLCSSDWFVHVGFDYRWSEDRWLAELIDRIQFQNKRVTGAD
jgi:hypothetical protein